MGLWGRQLKTGVEINSNQLFLYRIKNVTHPQPLPKASFAGSRLPARSKFQGGKRLWPCNPPQALLRSLTSDKRKGKVGLRALAGWLWISHLQNGSLSENSRPVDSQQQQLSLDLEDGVIVCVQQHNSSFKGFLTQQGTQFQNLTKQRNFDVVVYFNFIFLACVLWRKENLQRTCGSQGLARS